jgi:hypothetical protein
LRDNQVRISNQLREHGMMHGRTALIPTVTGLEEALSNANFLEGESAY